MTTDTTRQPSQAMPVYLAPAPGAASKNITTATTTEIKESAGYVTNIAINTGVAATTLKLYDGDPAGSGVLLGTWSTAAQNGIPVNIPFATALYAVTSGLADVTVSYV